MAITLQT